MSERLRLAYLRKYQAEILEKVRNLPWNKKHRARMSEAGKKYRERHPEGFKRTGR